MNLLSRFTAAFRSTGRSITAAAPMPPPTGTRPILGRLTLPSVSLSPWQWNLYTNPTPLQVKQILELGLQGDLAGQWELFRIMQDTWPRLKKNLDEIRSAASSSKWLITPSAEHGAQPTAEAIRRADTARRSLLTWSPAPGSDENGFEGCLYDLTDAFACGISMQELLWEQRDGALRPRASVWVHPKLYGMGQDGRLGLRNQQATALGSLFGPARPGEVHPLPADKFLVATHRGSTGAPGGWALLRSLAWWWCASLWGRDWLLNFAQVYGQPIRWATHDPSCDAATLATLDQMMEQLGSSGWGRFPAGTSLDLKESSKTSGESPQDDIQDRADKACDLLILGETLTSDVGDSGSLALGTVHQSVRNQRIAQLARWLADVLNYQLLPSFCRLNFGDDRECPTIKLDDTQPPDLDKLATRLQTLSSLGLPIPAAWAHDQFGVPAPKAGEPVLEKAAAFAPGQFGIGAVASDAPRSLKARQEQTAGDRTHFTASSPAPSHPRDIPAEIATRQAAALAQVFRGAMAPIREIVQASTSATDLEHKLSSYYADWPAARIADVMEQALQVMAAAGAADAVQNHAG